MYQKALDFLAGCKGEEWEFITNGHAVFVAVSTVALTVLSVLNQI